MMSDSLAPSLSPSLLRRPFLHNDFDFRWFLFESYCWRLWLLLLLPLHLLLLVLALVLLPLLVLVVGFLVMVLASALLVLVLVMVLVFILVLMLVMVVVVVVVVVLLVLVLRGLFADGGIDEDDAVGMGIPRIGGIRNGGVCCSNQPRDSLGGGIGQ